MRRIVNLLDGLYDMLTWGFYNIILPVVATISLLMAYGAVEDEGQGHWLFTVAINVMVVTSMFVLGRNVFRRVRGSARNEKERDDTTVT